VKVRPPFANVHLLRIAAACAVLACSFSTGCKSPWGWWGGGSGGSMYGSATPDVGKQKYDGLSQDFSGGAAGAYKSPSAANDNYVTSAWKKSTAAVGSAFTWNSKPAQSDDPTSLDTKHKPIGPDVFIAAGQMYETQGKYPEALGQYEKALKAAPNDLPAIISIARLHDRQGNFPKALEAYNRAVASHPKTGLVYNDLGLCYARHKESNKAIASLTQACALAPKTAKYRNNLATVLVEAGHTEEAYKQLKALNSEGVAHYNLAIMLTARGKQAEAASHLQLALNAEPDLQAARELLAQVTGQPMPGAPAPQGAYAQMAANPQMTQQQAVSMFHAGPSQRTQGPPSSPFQTASQSSNNPVEITFPTAPTNGQPAVPQVTIPQGPAETSYRIGDEEGPQLLPPVTE
jgi:tetratricopeptide (TPR) repeat protein